MSGEKRLTILSGAFLCSIGLMIFSFFINYKFPVRLVSFAGLTISALIIARNLRSLSDFKKLYGDISPVKTTLLFLSFGIVSGTGLAVLYRWYLDISLFPISIHSFVIVAALIGGVEEFVFRGFLQEYVKEINGPFSVLFSTLSHTGYKCFLFLSPVSAADIDVGFLALWTFGAGILFGTIRHLSKSLLPSLSAHILFDILVYAEFAAAPWWVW